MLGLAIWLKQAWLYMPVLATEHVFRKWTRKQDGKPVRDGETFGSLSKLVITGGGAIFRISYIIAVFCLICGTGVSLIEFFLASTGKGREEAKEKLKTSIITTLILSGLIGIIGTVVGVFQAIFPVV